MRRRHATCNLAGLPIELQRKVLTLILVIANPISPFTHYVHANRTLIPIAQTCKKLYAVATDVYYTQNTFLVKRFRYSTSGCIPLLYPNPAVGGLVRNLIVSLKINFNAQTLAQMLNPRNCALESDWRTLLQPTEADFSYDYDPFPGPPLLHPPGLGKVCLPNIGNQECNGEHRSADPTYWQSVFPALQQLKVVLTVSRSNSVPVCCIYGFGAAEINHVPRRDGFLENVKGAQIVLRAEKVVVDLQGVKCDPLCRENCAQVISKTVKDMFEA